MPSIPGRIVELILHKTTREKPAHATHWSTRTLARDIGVSRSTIHRVWQAHGLKPHLVKTFKIPNDPRFVEKIRDIVGLYLSPPERALVLSCDEKSQIQALDRIQKSLPLRPGRLGTMTHDYQRNGTTTLFAAIELAEGRLIAECMPRHRHQEWLRFLKKIDAETPAELDLHLIVDNYATHKHPKVKAWLKRHPLPRPLHPHQQFLAEPDRALVSRDHRQAHPPRSLPKRSATDRGDHGLRRQPQPRSPLLRLDRPSPGNPRQGRPRRPR